MNNIRNQKRNLTKALKTIPILESNRYDANQYTESKIGKQQRNSELAVLYSSNNQHQRRHLRYGRISTEHQGYAFGAKLKNSIELKSIKYMKINSSSVQRDSCFRNPYLPQKRVSILMRTKNSEKKSTPSRRLLTHEAIRKDSKSRQREPSFSKQKHEHIDLAALCQKAKSLFSNGQILNSLMVTDKILKLSPDHLEALYINGSNHFSQLNYIKCLVSINRLIQLDPLYNKSAYIMSSICYSSLGKHKEAQQKINTCLTHFPDFYEAHYEKAKLLMKVGSFQQAVNSLKRSLKLTNDTYDSSMKLGECYEKLKQYDLAYNVYTAVARQKNIHSKGYGVYLRKAKILQIQQQYDEYIDTLQTYVKLMGPKNRIVNLAEIMYQIGYGYYKVEDFANSIMALEEVFKEKDSVYITKSLILLAIINIKKRDFYEACHILARREHLNVDFKQIFMYENFCEGVVCLMKRKLDIGLEKLESIQFVFGESSSNQFKRQISCIYPMFLAYAYFCEGETEKCLESINKLLEENNEKILPYKNGLEFNKYLCQGLQHYRQSSLKKAIKSFRRSINIYPTKPEGYLYLAITQIRLYLNESGENEVQQIKINLQKCIENLKQLNNNYAASAFYIKAAFSAYLGQWDNAINQIDESIERSEDNDAKSFYLRALILGCCQNYKQAISEVSIAISINENIPQYYLLRSKCGQIDGDGNKAFIDLQSYINLNPDDNEIHKYAGHLLFENGAFEDAIHAYDNGEIELIEGNYDVFLTRAKTFFLLGQFSKAAQDMQTAVLFRPNQSVQFDIEITKLLHRFFQAKQRSKEELAQLRKELDACESKGEGFSFGKIFKKMQISCFRAILLFYGELYQQAIRQFKESILLKQRNFNPSSEEQFEEEEKDKHFFISQMYYNKAICHIILNETSAAIRSLQSCQIDKYSNTFQRLKDLKNFLQENENPFPGQLFSQKNKMSNHLEEISITLQSGRNIKMRLCVPFPKVEPPEINPQFDKKIINELDVDSIEKKPEAPWIIREQNSIKFTEKIQSFSRLEMNDSQLSHISREKKKEAMRIGSKDSFSQSDESQMESLKELKQKLRLDTKVENKLNRILKQR